MSNENNFNEDASLLLAAEECDRAHFSQFHKFSQHDERIIRKLMAHGPVLLQGGRGSGKSALMIEASRRLAPAKPNATVFGLYVSLRYVPLLKAEGEKYEHLFCEWVSGQLRNALEDTDFSRCSDLLTLKEAISELSAKSGKRVVLLFDDAAHIGRETSLSSFFDLFRTLSSDTISCKASIYPGVTEFGTRFDVFNDATTVDVVRAPSQVGFRELFASIMAARYPTLTDDRFTGMKREEFAAFLAISVLGNVRGFVFACNNLIENNERSLGVSALSAALLKLAVDYYWPLLEEVKPKLGKYTPFVETSQEIAEILFREAGQMSVTSILLHRQLVMRYSKPIEILEYAGFVAKREASRAMKSGGRGARYAVNLCNILEQVRGTRLTSQLFRDWLDDRTDPVEIHERGEQFRNLKVPVTNAETNLAILGQDISVLKRSTAYPYGLTDLMIERLRNTGFTTVWDVARADDCDLRKIQGIGEKAVKRIRSTIEQAIWM
jgi:hypothetical protein